MKPVFLQKTFLFAISTMLIASCSWFSKEDPYEKEQKEIKKFMDDSKTLIPYKGVKIALRVDYSDTSEANKKISKTGLEALSAISALLMKDTLKIGLKDAFETYQKFK